VRSAGVVSSLTRLREHARRRLAHDRVGCERAAQAHEHAARGEAHAEDERIERELELEHARREQIRDALRDQGREQTREDTQAHELDDERREHAAAARAECAQQRDFEAALLARRLHGREPSSITARFCAYVEATNVAG